MIILRQAIQITMAYEINHSGYLDCQFEELGIPKEIVYSLRI